MTKPLRDKIIGVWELVSNVEGYKPDWYTSAQIMTPAGRFWTVDRQGDTT